MEEFYSTFLNHKFHISRINGNEIEIMRYAFKCDNTHSSYKHGHYFISRRSMQAHRVICNMNAQDEDVFL